MNDNLKSYDAVAKRWSTRLREFRGLVQGSRSVRQGMTQHVAKLIDSCHQAEVFVQSKTGLVVHGLRILEIGPGQLPRQIAYFARANQVTGIDLDVIPLGFQLGAYLRLLKQNGPGRTIKTVARKMLGFDRGFRKEMARQLGLGRLPAYDLRQMDAGDMSFPQATFDLVYSFDVFEHLPDPARILASVVRVLRPGGVFYTSLHPFTAEDGNHDMQIISGRREAVPYWAHLRPAHQHQTHASVHLNRLRLRDWTEILQSQMPGCVIDTPLVEDPVLLKALAQVRGQGELADFTDQELLVRRLIVVWRKPTADAALPAGGAGAAKSV